MATAISSDGLEKIAQILVEKGANVNATNDSDSALILAAENGEIQF